MDIITTLKILFIMVTMWGLIAVAYSSMYALYKAFRQLMNLSPPNFKRKVFKAIDPTYRKPTKNLYSNYCTPEEIYTNKIREYIQLGYISETRFNRCVSIQNGSLDLFTKSIVSTSNYNLSLVKSEQKVNKLVMIRIENIIESLLNPKLKSITKINKQLTCCATGDLLTKQEIKDSKWCNDCKIVISPNALLLTVNKCPHCNSRSLTKYNKQ